ncbi:MAG: LytTR family DNA-binding domain-containing protein [Butyrivibrio sp.]|nr:LytTR family DNA-binding domain-containing protein [Butyrivibrio sp.]
MLRIGICDDERAAVEAHAEQIRNIMRQMGMNADIRKCYTGDELLLEIEESGKFHIILLDIKMERINGIEVAKKIRRMDAYVVIIFISAFDQYCKEAISVQPYAFLDKPLQQSQIRKAIEEAYKRQIEEKETYDFKYGRVYYSVDLREIYYFSSDRRKIFIAAKQEEYWFYGKLDQVEQTLSKKKHRFLRIHKSFLVNSRYIVRYYYEKVVLQNGEELEISMSKRNSIRKYYMESLER